MNLMSNKDKSLPNFLIVGAAKSGTTSLFNYLNQHPDIFIPSRKECRFFSDMPRNFIGGGSAEYQNDTVQSIEGYKELFQNGKQAKAKGDISNDYLYYYNKSIKNIKKYLGSNVKIIIILRNPIDRAYSNYLHHVREGWEELSFEEALAKEEERKRNNYAWPFYYKEVGMYCKQVKAYLDAFSNVRIYLFEELFNMPRLLSSLFDFIGVADLDITNLGNQYNVSGYPKIKFIHNLITKKSFISSIIRPAYKCLLPSESRKKITAYIKNNNLQKMPMNNDTRQFLKNYFRDDILKLNSLIDKDCTAWLQ